MEEQFEGESAEELLPDGATAAFDAALAERERKTKAKQKLRFAADHIGWAIVLLVAVWIALMLLIFEVCGAAFYRKYYLILNEVTLFCGIAAAAGILFPVPRMALHKEKITLGGFLKLLVICFGVGYVGNLIGLAWLSVWNLFTGNSVGNDLIPVLYGANPLVMFISVAILAPLLEELIFRKFLTERLRVFGETVAILIPALLFALFHTSASQLVYAFTIGVLLGYFYCRTGNYWLTVLIHAIFNTVSGVIPMLFLPKINAFSAEMAFLEASMPADVAIEEMAELMMPLLEKYGFTLGLYALYTLVIFTVNVTGVILLIVNLRKFKSRKGEFSLPAEDSVKSIFKTSGMIVCILWLVILTVRSMFS